MKKKMKAYLRTALNIALVSLVVVLFAASFTIRPGTARRMEQNTQIETRTKIDDEAAIASFQHDGHIFILNERTNEVLHHPGCPCGR